MRNEFERAVLMFNSHRRHVRTRIAAVFGSATLILLACWGAGVFDQWRDWFGSKAQVAMTDKQAPVAPHTPPVSAPAGPAGVADDGAIGKLRLVATQPGRNVREGTAQLATGGAAPLTFVAGALLANGASLLEIHADHVVLKREAMTTELYIDGAARSARAGKASQAREELLTVSKPEPQPAKAFGPETYANLLRAVPRFVDTKISGFEVYAGRNGGALSRLSLQSGDVLLEIDGRVLTSVEQLHGSLKAIRDGASLTATVERGTQQLVVTLDGAMLKEQQIPALAVTKP